MRRSSVSVISNHLRDKADATGRLKTISDGFDDRIESLQKSIDRQTAQFEAQREKITREFIALESAISELNNTSSFLATQLAGI